MQSGQSTPNQDLQPMDQGSKQHPNQAANNNSSSSKMTDESHETAGLLMKLSTDKDSSAQIEKVLGEIHPQKIQITSFKLLLDGSVKSKLNDYKKFNSWKKNIFGKDKPSSFKVKNKKGVYNAEFFSKINCHFGTKVFWKKEENCIELMRTALSKENFFEYLKALLKIFNNQNNPKTNYKIRECYFETVTKKSKKSTADKSNVEMKAEAGDKEQESSSEIYYYANNRKEEHLKDKIKFRDPKLILEFFKWIINQDASRLANFFNLKYLAKACNDAECKLDEKLVTKMSYLTNVVEENPQYKHTKSKAKPNGRKGKNKQSSKGKGVKRKIEEIVPAASQDVDSQTAVEPTQKKIKTEPSTSIPESKINSSSSSNSNSSSNAESTNLTSDVNLSFMTDDQAVAANPQPFNSAPQAVMQMDEFKILDIQYNALISDPTLLIAITKDCLMRQTNSNYSNSLTRDRFKQVYVTQKMREQLQQAAILSQSSTTPSPMIAVPQQPIQHEQTPLSQPAPFTASNFGMPGISPLLSLGMWNVPHSMGSLSQQQSIPPQQSVPAVPTTLPQSMLIGRLPNLPLVPFSMWGQSTGSTAATESNSISPMPIDSLSLGIQSSRDS